MSCDQDVGLGRRTAAKPWDGMARRRLEGGVARAKLFLVSVCRETGARAAETVGGLVTPMGRIHIRGV